MTRPTLTRKYLRSLIRYYPSTGKFVWRARPIKNARADQWWNTKWAGKPCGTWRPDGYLQIYIDHVAWRAHRLAFIYMLDRLPAIDVDHINRNRSDNRWKNLREASRSQNLCNRNLGYCPYCGRGY